MNSKSKEELVEQYEDAAFELLMSEYAEQEGNRLLREFEEAKAKGEVPEIPAALDAKCRKMIRQAYESDRRKKWMHKTIKTMTHTAAVLFVTLGVCATLVVSVEALRTPFVNFLIEQHEHFSAIDFDQETIDKVDVQPSSAPMDSQNKNGPLGSIIPEGYELYKHSIRDDGSEVIIYQNATGNTIFLSTTVMKGDICLDTENADSERIRIAGFEGFFIRKNEEYKMTWFNTEKEMVFQIKVNGLSKAEFWILAEMIAKEDLGG